MNMDNIFPCQALDNIQRICNDCKNCADKHKSAYKPVPTTFPPPPSGEEWQNPSCLTPTQVEVDKGYRLVLKSEVRRDAPLKGKVELYNSGTWWKTFAYGEVPYCDSPDVVYRTLEPLPSPTSTGLVLGDAPVGSVVRIKSIAGDSAKLTDFLVVGRTAGYTFVGLSAKYSSNRAIVMWAWPAEAAAWDPIVE